MAIFGGSEKQTATAAAPAKGGTPAAASLSIIGAGMTVLGDVETSGVVKVEGAVNGQVKANAQVLVAKGGHIDGDVETGEAVIAGIVHGSIRAAQRVEIQAGAVVQGDITTRRILVAEGAVLNGAVRMGDADQAEVAAPNRPAAQPTLPRPSGPLAPVAVSPRANAPH